MRRIRQITAVFTTALLLLTASKPANAILYRHDIDPDAFLRNPDQFPAVFSVAPGNGGATLIAPQWAATAAHVTQLFPEDGTHTVQINGESYNVVQVVRHSAWDGIHFDDIALFRLDRPVTDVAPIPLYSGEGEVGEEVLILGSGDHANGLDGAQEAGRDGQFRGATNLVERVESGSLWLAFDAPDSPNVTEFEGVAGPGDSGGPALMQVNGRYHLVGVASFGIDLSNPPLPPGTYGTFDTYTSISRNLDWIEAVLDGETVAEPESNRSAGENVAVVVETAVPDAVANEPVAVEIIENSANNSKQTGAGLVTVGVLFALVAVLLIFIIRRQRTE